jgi:hypothetical protein
VRLLVNGTEVDITTGEGDELTGDATLSRQIA